jgi:hypothetical protein
VEGSKGTERMGCMEYEITIKSPDNKIKKFWAEEVKLEDCKLENKQVVIKGCGEDKSVFIPTSSFA